MPRHNRGCNKWNTTKLNGTQCKVEAIEEIARQRAHTCLFGDWRMLWIDEADGGDTTHEIWALLPARVFETKPAQ